MADILTLCASCDAPLGAGRYCASCEQVSETYAWPEGEPAFYEPGYNPERVQALLADRDIIRTVERIVGGKCREKEGGMIGRFRLSANRSAALRAKPATRSYRFAPLPHIARLLPHPLALLACAAICVVANIAIWRLHHG